MFRKLSLVARLLAASLLVAACAPTTARPLVDVAVSIGTAANGYPNMATAATPGSRERRATVTACD